MNEWRLTKESRSPLYEVVLRCTYRRMCPRIEERENRPAQFLIGPSKCTFDTPSRPCLGERRGNVQNVHGGSQVGRGRAIKSHPCWLQNLELFNLEKSSHGAQLWPLHSGGFSKVESTDVISFITEVKTKTRMGGRGVRETVRRQISAGGKKLFKNQGYRERGWRGGR